MKQTLFIAVLVIITLLVGTYVAYLHFFFDSPQTAETLVEPVVADDDHGIKVVRAEGTVERLRGESGWLQVSSGDRIAVADAVRTADDSRAELEVGDGSRIFLENASELLVRRADNKETRFRLRRGRLRANKRRSGKTLHIEAPDTDATVSSDEGSFTVSTDGLGTLAVATTAGNAKLKTKNAEKTIGEGQQSVALPDGSVTATVPIPKSLLLKIGKLPTGVRRKRNLVLKGRTEVGATVTINGVRAKVDRKGRFRTRVRLREGNNELAVVARGVSGLTREMKLDPIEVDSRAPSSKIDARWE
ncbi:MAG: FecR domain-containing protein [Myxococcota bacterium]